MNNILAGDVRSVLATLPENSIHMVMTSPPYYGLRDYDTQPLIWDGLIDCQHTWGEPLPAHHAGQVEQSKWKHAEGTGKGGNARSGNFCLHCAAWRGSLGLEPTPELYITHLVQIFQEVRRVLRADGTLWLNIGDSYAGSGKGQYRDGERDPKKHKTTGMKLAKQQPTGGLKPKDLIGIPWMLAFALRADGWYLRQEIIWHKPNALPASVLDRPTRSHEQVFLLSKSRRYYYDTDAVREPHQTKNVAYEAQKSSKWGKKIRATSKPNVENYRKETHAYCPLGRNRRSVWSINTKGYPGAHFAVFPEKLVEPCILAGSSPRACERCGAPWRHQGSEWHATCRCLGSVGSGKCLVLDPFCGAGTTLLVAAKFGRAYLGVDLNNNYVQLATDRLAVVQPDLWQAS